MKAFYLYILYLVLGYFDLIVLISANVLDKIWIKIPIRLKK